VVAALVIEVATLVVIVVVVAVTLFAVVVVALAVCGGKETKTIIHMCAWLPIAPTACAFVFFTLVDCCDYFVCCC